MAHEELFLEIRQGLESLEKFHNSAIQQLDLPQECKSVSHQLLAVFPLLKSLTSALSLVNKSLTESTDRLHSRHIFLEERILNLEKKSEELTHKQADLHAQCNRLEHRLHGREKDELPTAKSLLEVCKAAESQLNFVLSRMDNLLKKLELALGTTEFFKAGELFPVRPYETEQSDEQTDPVPPPEWSRNKREVTIDPNQSVTKRKPTIPDYDFAVAVIDEDDWNAIHKKSLYFTADDAAELTEDALSGTPIDHIIDHIESVIKDAAKVKNTEINLGYELSRFSHNLQPAKIKEQEEKVIGHFTSAAIGFRFINRTKIGSFKFLSWEHLVTAKEAIDDNK